MVKAMAQITIRDENDISIGTTPPSSPIKDQLWMDTSKSPSVLKRYTGSTWEVSTEMPKTNTPPSPATVNQIWMDTSKNPPVLKRYDGKVWQVVNDPTNDIKDAIDKVQVGGRNLIKNSDFIVEATKTSSAPSKSVNLVDGIDINESLLGKTVTFSYFVNCPGNRVNGNQQGLGSRFGIHGAVQWKNSSTGVSTMEYPFADCLVGSYDKKRVSMTYTFNPPSGFDTILKFSFSFQPYARPDIDNNTTWKIGQPKLELGNKATDWTPAPEDITNALADKPDKTSVYTKTETDSKIKLETGAITSKVSTLEETQLKTTPVASFRYIRDWLNGSNANTGNYWVELQVFVGTTNIAKGILPTSTVSLSNSAYYTDGDSSVANNYVFASGGWKYLQLDLKTERNDVDMIKVWHYYTDKRKYNHRLEVSRDGIVWYSLFDSDKSGRYAESPDGRTYVLNESSTEKRLSSAEQKITPNAIIATVQSTVNQAKTDAISNANSSTDNKLKDYSTTTQMNTAIEQKANSITQTVSSTYLSKTDATDSYATKSSLTQTSDSIIAKFSSSGGYNVIKNSGFKNSLNGWWIGAYNPNGTNRSISVSKDDSLYVLDGTCALVMRSTNNTSGEFRVDSQKFKVKQNTNYTLSYLVASHRATVLGHYVRGNEWEILASKSYLPKEGGKNRENWTRITQTFNTGTNHQISLNFIHGKTGDNAYSWITDVMVNEGLVALPWSPHPSETYEGSTMIDADGVTIKNGAIKIENKKGQTVLSGDSEGNLSVTGSVHIHGDIGEQLKIDAKEKIGTGMPSLYSDGHGLGVLRLKVGYYDSPQGQLTSNHWSAGIIGTDIDPFKGIITSDYEIGGTTTIKGGVISCNTISTNSTGSFKGRVHTNGGLAQNGNVILNGSDTWLRTYGDTGWYNATYQGGWYMTDTSWIRAYNSKSIYTPGSLQAVTSTYTRLLASNRLCGWDNSYKFYLGATDAATRIDCTGGILRLYTSWLGANDNGVAIDWRGGVTIKYDSKIIHAFNTNGTKNGGTIEIEGTTYGMSPIDSPQTLISYIEYDIEIDVEKTIYLDPIYRKMISKYSVFSSNPDIKIVEKTEEYFRVKGTGVADFDIKGQRREAQEYFKIMGGFEHGSEEEVSY